MLKDALSEASRESAGTIPFWPRGKQKNTPPGKYWSLELGPFFSITKTTTSMSSQFFLGCRGGTIFSTLMDLFTQVGEARLAFQKLQHPQLEEAHVLLDVAIPAYMSLNDPPKVRQSGVGNMGHVAWYDGGGGGGGPRF